MKRGGATVLQTTMLFELIAGVLAASILVFAMVSNHSGFKIDKSISEKNYESYVSFMKTFSGNLVINYDLGELENTNSGLALTLEGPDLIEKKGKEIKKIA